MIRNRKRVRYPVIAGLCLWCLLPGRPAVAVMLDRIYSGESVVDLQIYNDLTGDWKKFVLKRGDDLIQAWETQTEADLYFSDTVAPFSSNSYTLLSYTSTNGVSWSGYGTDTANANTANMSGTLHNSLDWQILLDREAVYWMNQTNGYLVSYVNVVDGDLGIYNTTLWLNDSARYLKATGPGTITASGVTFASLTAAGGWVEFADQSAPAVDSIDDCAFQFVDLKLTSSAGMAITNSEFNDCQVTSDGSSSGTLFDRCSGSYDLSVNGDGETVRDCAGILELYLSGTGHSILRNGVRNIEARGDSCTIQGNTFSSETYVWPRFDIYGSSNQVLENTLEHWVPDGCSAMIRIPGNSNTVEANVITEYAPDGAWSAGIHVQNGADNTVQLNRITGYSTNNHGIVLDGATQNLVKKNTIKNCQNGIWLGFPNPAAGNNIENNVISSTSRAAIDVGTGCDSNAFAFNHIWDGSTGIYVSGDGNGFHENVIDDCSYRGIELNADATNTWVYNNIFRNNSTHAFDGGTGNTWNKPKTLVNSNIVGGPYLGGNYWDDYSGPDADGDKLGDTPRPIGGAASAADQLPLIYVALPSPTPTPTPETIPIDSGDYNGDGTSDIAVFRGSSGLWSVRNLTRVYFGASGDTPVSSDYNGDHTSDIAVFRPSSSLWSARNLTRVYFGNSTDSPIPGDYSGDGTTQACVFRPLTGLWSVRNVTRVYFGSSADEPIPGPYSSASSRKLPAVYRPSSGLWSIKDLTRFYFGSSTDTPVPGDYDADGAWEAAIFRAASGLWSVRNSTRAYFGSSVDRPVPADYNGDVRDDMGLFRDSSGLWAVRNVTRVYFGATDDIPVTR